MDQQRPLVSIGIPTYCRASLLRRSIESALSQDYDNIEVVVSDNASTDDTENVCRSYSLKDARLKYVRQSRNRGATANFQSVLGHASGEYFMWLGDDDWLDETYVRLCAAELISDRRLSLVSGIPRYYRNGSASSVGEVFDLLHHSSWLRLFAYYLKVKDNGAFYGVMRTLQLKESSLRNTMGGDWLLIAAIVFMGKAKVLSGTAVHREMGGATTSYRKIAESLGLPMYQARFPMLSIAISASIGIASGDRVFSSKHEVERFIAAIGAFVTVLAKAGLAHLRARAQKVWRLFFGHSGTHD